MLSIAYVKLRSVRMWPLSGIMPMFLIAVPTVQKRRESVKQEKIFRLQTNTMKLEKMHTNIYPMKTLLLHKYQGIFWFISL